MRKMRRTLKPLKTLGLIGSASKIINKSISPTSPCSKEEKDYMIKRVNEICYMHGYYMGVKVCIRRAKRTKKRYKSYTGRGTCYDTHRKRYIYVGDYSTFLRLNKL